jgi:divalent metal cation (Fe/Co/Zn/Cd) transporter
MDSAADPLLIEKLKRTVGEIESVIQVRQTAARWCGQTLFAQMDVEVPEDMYVPEADKVRAGIQQAVRAQVCDHSQTLVRILPGAVSRKKSSTVRLTEDAGAGMVSIRQLF